MFPAQTSLIPVQIALARFWEQWGWSASQQLYPYWYLGTTPYRYLTGPILPWALASLHHIFPQLTLFTLMHYLITLMWIAGGAGVFWLVRIMGEKNGDLPAGGRGNLAPAIAAVCYLLGPLLPVMFRFSDGLFLIAAAIIPYILVGYLKFLRQPSCKWGAVAVFLIAFGTLLDSLILTPVLLGMVATLLAFGGWQKAERHLKTSAAIVAAALILATVWYTPGYWLTLLQSPSFGGKSLAAVIAWLGKLLPIGLALALAVISAKSLKRQSPLARFIFYWLFTFLFLTVIRFLSDPDFWLDWTGYWWEIQLGIGLAAGTIDGKLGGSRPATTKDAIRPPGRATHGLPLMAVIWLVVWLILFNKYVLGTMQREIERVLEYRIGSQLAQLAEPSQTVLLSGTTAFWLNAFFDIAQVRGGVDRASVHPDWRALVWEVREGQDAAKSLEWLQKTKVSYLVVHTDQSAEYYHDFAYPQKFASSPVLRKVFEKQGDQIFFISIH